ncbi:MAG: hypothetical protein EXR71_09745 [Myxococcales bacterium]|nr:hypothetical protein [Myxococcales bacterium]
MLILTLLLGCSWFEHRQACSAARDAETGAWARLERTLDGAVALARTQADASLAAAQAVDLAAGAAGAPLVTRDVNRGEMAQDAFTRGSRSHGTDLGLAQARWTDWSLRTQEQVAGTDALIETSRGVIERLSLWSRARADSSLAVALASTRYEAAARVDAARRTLAVALVIPPTPAADPQAAASHLSALEAAIEAHAERSRGLKVVLGVADKVAFEVERAGLTAQSTATNYPFLGFPPEAQVAQAAALAAESSAKRAAQAGPRLRAAVLAAAPAEDPAPAEDVSRALAAAVGLAHAADDACR